MVAASNPAGERAQHLNLTCVSRCKNTLLCRTKKGIPVAETHRASKQYIGLKMGWVMIRLWDFFHSKSVGEGYLGANQFCQALSFFHFLTHDLPH